MQHLVSVLLFVVGLINVAPVVGVTSRERLASAYGITIESASMTLLLRHRAVLFGIVGGLILVSVFHSPLRPAAQIAAGISMLSFVLLAAAGGHTPELGNVARVDYVGLGLLAAAVAIERFGG